MNLDTLLQRADIWRGGDSSLRDTGNSIPTGVEALDAQLPGGVRSRDDPEPTLVRVGRR